MQAIHLTTYTPTLTTLHPTTIPLPPPPKPSEALIKISHTALNHVDLLYAQGKHQNNTSALIKPPFTLGLEFAGTIVALGADEYPYNTTSTSGSSTCENPEGLRIGEKVFGAALGAFAEYIVVPLRVIRRVPVSVSGGWGVEDAAGLAGTATVAYGAVVVRGGVGRGQWVLVHGAAGGIGVYAVQIARAMGARVIAGVRDLGDKGKVGMLRGLGVEGVVETGGDTGWEGEVRRITGGRGVDVVIDNVGLVRGSLRCLRGVGGRIVLVGFAGREGVMEEVSVNRILLRQAVVVGYRYGDTDRKNPEETKQIWKGLMSLIEAGAIKPVTYEKSYHGLSSVEDAMADLQARKIYGKAVISIEENGKGRAAL
ncbi:hypothetical protein FQN50_005109 [Emmonsiellopsis sp. PD_5]|nr:hypothetical protein FQN50_005109 [Emmonsiellopsis sp. PD_5]